MEAAEMKYVVDYIKKNLSNDDLEICTVKLLNDVFLSDFETAKQLLD